MSRKEWKFTLLALILSCLMVSGSFVGLLDSTYRLTSEKNQNRGVVDESVALALDDIPLRNSADMVYDSESDRAIFFGGATELLDVDYNDTWSFNYNANTWTNMHPAISPPASNCHAMTYHSGQDKIVLFGGHVSGDGSSLLNHNQTWTYDFNTNTWTKMSPVLAPPAMAGAALEYDSESDLIVLVGGWPDGGMSAAPLAETWTYDLVSDTWTNVTTATQPSVRSWCEMTYDSDSDLMVFFGGFEMEPDPWKVLTDTWTYNANTNTWTEIDTIGPQITGELVYDIESDKVVFYGGAASMTEYIADLRSETWTYDTDTEIWEKMDTDIKPPVRARGELIYDSESDKIIVFSGVHDGGHSTEVVLGDCWAYDTNSNLWNNVEWDWQEMTPIVSPGTRCCSPLVYDIESDRMVVFSGWNNLNYNGSRYNDTWSYDYNTNTWTNMLPSVQPTGRGGHSMAYSQKADAIIMFGGSIGHQTDYDKFSAETWMYNLNTNTWTNMSPANNPTPRAFASMTYDNKSDVFVLFGGWPGGWGNTYHDTWIYNLTSNTWTNATTSIHPEGALLGSLMYEYTNNRIIYAGGNSWVTFQNKIWEYNTTQNLWTELVATTSAPSFGIGLAYDIESEIIVATGGPLDLDESIFVSETWKYNLTSAQWNNSYSPNNPPHRSRMYIAYDIESDRIIMYGGALPDGTQGEALGDTWAYSYKVNPPQIKAGPVQNLAVNPSGNNLVVTWEAPISKAEVTIIGYNVYRGKESGVYSLLAEIGDIYTYTDRTAGFGISYYYVVLAVTATVEGEYCDEVMASLPWNPVDDGVFSFIAYGDTRSSDATAVSPIHDDLVSMYMQYDPEMIIHSGDMVNHGGESYQWPLFNDSISKIREWDPYAKFYGAVGNHEMYTDVYGVDDEDFSTYRSFFDFSDVVDEPGETELYYSFDWHGIHFIILNTAQEWSGEVYTYPTAQMEWLENDLSEEYNFTIVFSHYPLYSILADRQDRLTQAESLRNTFHQLFNESGVDMVFMGHNHYYYRTVRDGIYYITAATGGAPLYDIQEENTDWINGDIGFSEYHYCVLSIVGNMLVVKTVLLNKTIAETFEIQMWPIDDGNGVESTLDPLLIIGIAGGAALVIIVIVLYLRKKK